MELIPIKVKIGLRPNGHADHPNWDTLPLIAGGESINDHVPFGWVYDKSCGHKEASVDSPLGMQWGMLLCTRAFADDAKATFPTLVTELTELECQDFWDTKAHAHMPANRLDRDELTALEAERNLRIARSLPVIDIDTRIDKALDPNDPTPGVTKDKKKYWTDYKALTGTTIKK